MNLSVHQPWCGAFKSTENNCYVTTSHSQSNPDVTSVDAGWDSGASILKTSVSDSGGYQPVLILVPLLGCVIPGMSFDFYVL